MCSGSKYEGIEEAVYSARGRQRSAVLRRRFACGGGCAILVSMQWRRSNVEGVGGGGFVATAAKGLISHLAGCGEEGNEIRAGPERTEGEGKRSTFWPETGFCR
jgi:hypothetical protein